MAKTIDTYDFLAKKWEEIKSLSKEEMFALLSAYDKYVYGYYQEHDEGEPVGVLEFFDNEFQEEGEE